MHIIWTRIFPVAHRHGAGVGDRQAGWLAGFSLTAAANKSCQLSESSSNSNWMCTFSLLNLQPLAWTQRPLNASYSIMASVIVPLVLQGLFTVLIKQAHCWPWHQALVCGYSICISHCSIWDVHVCAWREAIRTTQTEHYWCFLTCQRLGDPHQHNDFRVNSLGVSQHSKGRDEKKCGAVAMQHVLACILPS